MSCGYPARVATRKSKLACATPQGSCPCAPTQTFRYGKQCCTEPPSADDCWVDFPLNVIGTTTNPAKPTDTADYVESARYRVEGSVMHVQVYYMQSAAGTAGSGTYLIELPLGYSYANLSTRPVVGSAFFGGSGYIVYGSALATDSTNTGVAGNLVTHLLLAGINGSGGSGTNVTFAATTPGFGDDALTFTFDVTLQLC